MAVHNLNRDDLIVPSDVFGRESDTDVGYKRDTFALTYTGSDPLAVGTAFIANYADFTAVVATAPADVAAVEAMGDVTFFVGRDLPTDPKTAEDYDNLLVYKSGNVVGIGRGDGGGTLHKKYLKFGDKYLYELPKDVRIALEGKLRQENRFKLQDQV